MGGTAEDHDQAGGQGGQDDDPVREREPVAAQGELARHVPVARKDREQPRERVEARVRGEEEQQRGERLEQVEEEAVAVHRPGDLGDDGLLLRELDRDDREVDRQERDADEEGGQQRRHDRERGRGIPRLGRLEGRHAGRDRLCSGQRHGTGREGA